MKRGFEENVSVPEGVNWQGVATTLHFEGDTLTVQKTYDAEPHLEHVRQMREAQEGQNRWGEGRWVGHIPPIEAMRLMAIPGQQERRAAIKAWFRDHGQYVAYDKYLKR